MQFKYIIYLFIFSLLSSCNGGFFDPVVELELPEPNNNLAISTHFSDLDTLPLVYLTTTTGILEPDNTFIFEEIEVSLFEENTLIQQFDYEHTLNDTAANGTLVSRTVFIGEKINFKEGLSYKLQVETTQFDKIETTQTFPETIPILAGEFKQKAIADIFGDLVDQVTVKFKDLPNEENYYVLNIAHLTTDENLEVIKKYPIISSINPIVRVIGEGLLFSDITFDGQEYELQIALSDLNIELGGDIEISLTTISKDRFLFEEALAIYNDNLDNPFAEPIILHENVVGGNGIFTLGNGEQFIIPLE